MRIYYFCIVILLALFIPNENFILKWAPFSDNVYSALRFAQEILIYIIFIFVLGTKIKGRKKIVIASIHAPLILFIIYSLLVIFINKAPIGECLINLRSFLRYIVVFYIITNLIINEDRVKTIITCIVIIGTINSVLATYQHFAGISPVWLPRATTLEVAGRKTKFTIIEEGYHGGREKGAAIGLFGDTVPFALFQVFVCTILFSAVILTVSNPFRINLTLLFFLIINMAGLFFTYSRGTALSIMIAIPLIILLSKRWTALKIAAVALATVIFILSISTVFDDKNELKISKQNELKEKSVSPWENVQMVLNENYYSDDTYSRSWVLFVLGKSILHSNLFGYGPSPEFAKEKIFRTSDYPMAIIKILDYEAFEDVYWVAMLAYYGVVGVFIFGYILWILYRKSMRLFRSSDNFYARVLGISFAVLIIQTIFLTFIVRTFEFRVFGFYFWLLAGLVYSYMIYLEKKQDDENVPQPV